MKDPLCQIDPDDAGTLKAALTFGLETEEEDEVKALIERRAPAAEAQVFAAR